MEPHRGTERDSFIGAASAGLTPRTITTEPRGLHPVSGPLDGSAIADVRGGLLAAPFPEAGSSIYSADATWAMPLNAKWHADHVMPRNPTMDDRIRWHLAHARACGCRAMPESVRAAIRRQRTG